MNCRGDCVELLRNNWGLHSSSRNHLFFLFIDEVGSTNDEFIVCIGREINVVDRGTHIFCTVVHSVVHESRNFKFHKNTHVSSIIYLFQEILLMEHLSYFLPRSFEKPLDNLAPRRFFCCFFTCGSFPPFSRANFLLTFAAFFCFA